MIQADSSSKTVWEIRMLVEINRLQRKRAVGESILEESAQQVKNGDQYLQLILSTLMLHKAAGVAHDGISLTSEGLFCSAGLYSTSVTLSPEKVQVLLLQI